MQSLSTPIDVSRLWPLFIALLIVAFLAFWPSYFGAGILTASGYIHFHSITATIWMALLIIQPWLIRTERYSTHKIIGKASYVFFPIVLAAMILLANHRIRIATPENYAIQNFILYLQIFLAFLFAVSYLFAIAFRKQPEVHARFMVCTGLTLIDPIFARILLFTMPVPIEYHQFITYAITDFVFLILIIAERHNRSGRWVFPTMLGLFLWLQAPTFFVMNSPTWKWFTEWFRSIPLT